MEDILNVSAGVNFEERIIDYEYHTHQPFTRSLENSDEIVIAVQHQDIYTVPSKSYLYIQGQLIREGATEATADQDMRLVRNGILFLFDEIKYKLNGVLVDQVRNPGIANTLKGYVSHNSAKVTALEVAGWMPPHQLAKINDKDGNFDVCIPMDTVMGFFEDYNKMLLQGKQELILNRSRNDTNAVILEKDEENATVKLKSVQWKIPYVRVSDVQKLKFLNFINKGKTALMPFRSWDLIEYPTLPATKKHTWTLKTSTNLEKPRYVIIGFQTDKKNNKKMDPSLFSNVNITNIKLHLNSEIYPYDELNIDFSKNHYSILYYMYQSFQHSYYGKRNEPLLTKEHFKDYAPIVVIDCSRQSEAIKSSTVDIRIEMEVSEEFKANTTAYALILHDALVEYNPLSGLVRRI
ncbi:uncharacterized protein [Rhodnius prolixus]|uniref:uncharacterized protein n=1 Tax=Rhodnius prolixus TaxID=13249 RepID=UPI003D18B32E